MTAQAESGRATQSNALPVELATPDVDDHTGHTDLATGFRHHFGCCGAVATTRSVVSRERVVEQLLLRTRAMMRDLRAKKRIAPGWLRRPE